MRAPVNRVLKPSLATVRVASCVGILALLAGCGSEDSAAGYIWHVVLTGIEDGCNAEPQGYQQAFDYTIYAEGALADLRIDGESFATGEIAGCNIEYVSPTMGEQRETGAWVTWVLTGEAVYRPGGTSCDLDVGVDWAGEEVFEVVESEDPGIAVGCTYTLAAQGTYVGKDE